ncbi:MAG: non-canonical purine NTP pyrophosphatase [Cyanobium sp.]
MAAAIPLVMASGNAGKIREFAALLADLPVELRAQPEGLEVEETGSSFAENARLKASAVARASGCWALADDSGLAVAALGGAPGVHSARYAASDPERIARLLRELEVALAAAGPGASRPAVAAEAASAAPPAEAAANGADRSARFTAALAVADPSGAIRLEVEGHCPGVILEAPRGEGGFGYDPLFLVPDLQLTFAEMDKATKGRIGHRGRAFAALEPQLRALLALQGG